MTSNLVEYYELSETAYAHPAPGEFRIAAAAVLSCGLCCRVIDGMGGPGYGTICKPCGDELKRGGLRGAVKWDDAEAAMGPDEGRR